MIKLFTVALVAGLVFESHSQPPITGKSSLGLKPMPFLPVKPYWPYYPTHIQCWTEWFDRDDPSGTGDWEVLYNLRIENPGKICPKPQGIQVETTTVLSVAAAGEVIFKSDTTTGFVCRKQDQPDNTCNDYRVRFSCHPPFCGGGVCWTDWFDRDDPSVTGDWETLASLKKQYPCKICETPLYIEAVTTDTMTPAIQTGENFLFYNPTQGFVCRKEDQSDNSCRDYKVRFGCPCDCLPEKECEEKIKKSERGENEEREENEEKEEKEENEEKEKKP